MKTSADWVELRWPGAQFSEEHGWDMYLIFSHGFFWPQRLSSPELQ